MRSKRQNRMERWHRSQARKERAANARKFIADGDSQDERHHRSERYKAERLRRGYAQVKRLEAEAKHRRKKEHREQQEYRQLKFWFRLLTKDPFASGYYDPQSGTKRSKQSPIMSLGETPSVSSHAEVWEGVTTVE